MNDKEKTKNTTADRAFVALQAIRIRRGMIFLVGRFIMRESNSLGERSGENIFAKHPSGRDGKALPALFRPAPNDVTRIPQGKRKSRTLAQ